MSRWLAMAEALENVASPCDRSTEVDKTQPGREYRGFVAFCQLSNGEEEKLDAPDIDAFEERAAIIEFEAGYPRIQAEDMAAQAQGYDNVVELCAAVKDGKPE